MTAYPLTHKPPDYLQNTLLLGQENLIHLLLVLLNGACPSFLDADYLGRNFTAYLCLLFKTRGKWKRTFNSLIFKYIAIHKCTHFFNFTCIFWIQTSLNMCTYWTVKQKERELSGLPISFFFSSIWSMASSFSANSARYVFMAQLTISSTSNKSVPSSANNLLALVLSPRRWVHWKSIWNQTN